MTLTPQEQAYFSELAAQIVETLGAEAVEAFQKDPLLQHLVFARRA